MTNTQTPKRKPVQLDEANNNEGGMLALVLQYSYFPKHKKYLIQKLNSDSYGDDCVAICLWFMEELSDEDLDSEQLKAAKYFWGTKPEGNQWNNCFDKPGYINWNRRKHERRKTV